MVSSTRVPACEDVREYAGCAAFAGGWAEATVRAAAPQMTSRAIVRRLGRHIVYFEAGFAGGFGVVRGGGAAAGLSASLKTGGRKSSMICLSCCLAARR